MEQERYTFDDLQRIMERLRAPDGCPWDRSQTHGSLKPCMIEEAAELLAAVDVWEATGDDANLIEELGDVLFQVVMHVAIAREQGRFTMEDVVTGISRKMIRRHPHVFAGASEASTATPEGWEEIKKSEKSHGGAGENPVARRKVLEEVVALLNSMAQRKGMREEIILLQKE